MKVSRNKRKLKNNISLFPTERITNIELTKVEIIELTKFLTIIYKEFIDEISLKLSKEFNLPRSELKIILRVGLIPIVHCYFERLLRIHKDIKVKKNIIDITVHKLPQAPRTIEDFYNNLNDEKYNQTIINHIASIWGDCVKINPEKVSFKTYKEPKLSKNYLGLLENKNLIVKINRKLENIFDFFANSKKIPVINLAQEENSFYKKGFYYLNFKNIKFKTEGETNYNHRHRELFFKKIDLKTNGLKRFMEKKYFTDNDIDLVTANLTYFIQKIFPIDLFEEIEKNYEKAKSILKPYKSKHIIFGGSPTSSSSFIMAVSKEKKMSVITLQHGGYYGYIKDIPRVYELEYSFSDIFVTWGWTENKQFPTCKFFPLPSPWLSERTIYWKKLKIQEDKRFDFLFLPQRLEEYTMPLTGAGNTRPDIIPSYLNEIIKLITFAKFNKASIFYKPYNQKTVLLGKETYKKIKKILGASLTISKNLNKGLNFRIVKNCHIVLWDQPGTGFLECITSKIPTMVIWTKLFNEEEKSAQKYFKKLENVGLIHVTHKSLFKELAIYKKDPISWMSNSERKKAINLFSKRYAFTCPEWTDSWNHYLKKIKSYA